MHTFMANDFSLTRGRITSYNGTTVAGRSVYRRRMGQTRYPELDRSTQLPTIQGSKTSRTKNLIIEY
jgi:hypothetical protein